VPELGAVDLVLLSHAHFDHLDLPTLKALPRTAKVVCSMGLSDLVRDAGWKDVVELKWGESSVVETERGGVVVSAIPTRHWGARVRRDTWRGWGGFVLEREGRRVLFGGDTAMTDTFRDVRARGKVDLALMPIGAYDPWIYAHCSPEEAVRMANEAGVDLIAPIHHQAFKLSHEPMRQPIERFQQALTRDEQRVAWREVGQTIVV
jgi:L-ascorbate metabolism protein UlaG (beta-lactamase superfamily)